MITWISTNIGTIIVILLIIAVIVFASSSIIRDKRRGKSSCGNNCAHCAMAGSCHKQ